jgi:hypothetical protein
LKWLTLTPQTFEPIPDTQFSLKKPLFAASVVLRFTPSETEVLAFTSLEARVPIKGLMHYTVEALSARAGRNFGFTYVRESDVSAGTTRETLVRGVARDLPPVGEAPVAVAPTARPSKKYVAPVAAVAADEWLEIDGAKVEVVNESPVPILAHVLALPAFVQTHSVEDDVRVYGAHLMVGRRVQALRLQRKGPAASALARSKYTFFVETYEGKLMTVAQGLSEKDFEALPWATRKSFEFDYNVETKQLVAARFTIPIFGTIEIKA